MFSFKTLYVFIVCVCMRFVRRQSKNNEFLQIMKIYLSSSSSSFLWLLYKNRKKEKKNVIFININALKKVKNMLKNIFLFLSSQILTKWTMFFFHFWNAYYDGKKALLLLLFLKDNWIEKQRNVKGIVRNQI